MSLKTQIMIRGQAGVSQNTNYYTRAGGRNVSKHTNYFRFLSRHVLGCLTNTKYHFLLLLFQISFMPCSGGDYKTQSFFDDLFVLTCSEISNPLHPTFALLLSI